MLRVGFLGNHYIICNLICARSHFHLLIATVHPNCFWTKSFTIVSCSPKVRPSCESLGGPVFSQQGKSEDVSLGLSKSPLLKKRAKL